MRSGEKAPGRSGFSLRRELERLPRDCRTESAGRRARRRRACEHDPGERQRVPESSGDPDESWPCISTTTKRVSTGFRPACRSVISCIMVASIARPPRSVDEQHVVIGFLAYRARPSAMAIRLLPGFRRKEIDAISAARASSAARSAAAGERRRKRGSGFFPRSLYEHSASSRRCRLPEPCRPASSTDRGRPTARSSAGVLPAQSAVQLRCTTPTAPGRGVRLRTTSLPAPPRARAR